MIYTAYISQRLGVWTVLFNDVPGFEFYFNGSLEECLSMAKATLEGIIEMRLHSLQNPSVILPGVTVQCYPGREAVPIKISAVLEDSIKLALKVQELTKDTNES